MCYNMLMDKLNFKGPVVLAILDGVGLAPDSDGNAVAKSYTPFLSRAAKDYPHLALEASGEAVGVLPGIMGNSEVGHNAIGSGQIIKQGIAKIEDAFNSGEVFNSGVWGRIIEHLTTPVNLDNSDDLWYNENIARKTLHFAGIFSDGAVHSDIRHLEKMIQRAYDDGVQKIRVHLVIDGRDVLPQSEPKYINRLEDFLKQFKNVDYKIASGVGRMVGVSDRYEADWNMVKIGWGMMVHAEADHKFHSAAQAIEYFRSQDSAIQDQYLPAFVIVDDDDEPVGRVRQGDAFIFYDFRADRAIEIAMAFTYENFPYFDRGDIMASDGSAHPYMPADVMFAGMTEYNSDIHVPSLTLVDAVHINDTLNQFLGAQGISQLAISETVKFGHITYYFNGNSYDKAPGEDHIKIESDDTEPNERPWMKAAEITDAAIANLDKYRFVRINFPNGDMVGHFADLASTRIAIETIDYELSRLAKKIDELGGCLIITADHGNAEELLDENGAKKTSHSLNLVPCIFYDNTKNRDKYQPADIKNPGLANLAATIATLLGQDNYPDKWQDPLIVIK